MRLRAMFIIYTVMLSGCVGGFTTNRELSLEGDGVLLDAKQRAIISPIRTEEVGRITCVEPSPDVFSGYSGGFSVSGAVGGVDAGASISEVASEVKLRGYTVQLLRDGMYRLCEAYMNGAISKDDYSHQLRRYQRNMISLLAIEQVAKISKNSDTGSSGAYHYVSDLVKSVTLQDDLPFLCFSLLANSEGGERVSAVWADSVGNALVDYAPKEILMGICIEKFSAMFGPKRDASCVSLNQVPNPSSLTQALPEGCK